ncbi:MAG TPA: ABC transporter permease [Clostridia bacterium]|nr:ABC transporter permease [Clostridia bacterium]
MNKFILLPKLSVMGIRKNGNAYFPYILAGIFSVFVFFVFTSILNNDIVKTLPRSAYAWLLLEVGQVLLGLILLPFILYTNSFLIKRRKKELGLYSVLGLDKKHIAVMMFWETLIIFIIIMVGGVLFGLVFSKLIFLTLLNMSGLPVTASFTFSIKALDQTFIYFLVVYLLNLIVNVVHVFRTNPNELIREPKKGDKEPKHLWFTALLGITLIGAGYAIAIPAKVDSNIFVNFLFAVALVSYGTHYFFKASLLALLKILKKSNGFYYRKSNYVTVSGMLHRLKKSASSLSNICIFGTMTIVTLLCTLSVWQGNAGILKHQYPYDVILNYNTISFQAADSLENKLQEQAKASNVGMINKAGFTYQKLHVDKTGNTFVMQSPKHPLAKRYAIKLITLDDYNSIENANETLAEKEVLIFATGADFGYDKVILGKDSYSVKKELDSVVFYSKATNDTFGQDYYLIVKDASVMDKLRSDFKSVAENDRILSVRFNLSGAEKDRMAFISGIVAWSKAQPGFNSVIDGINGRQETSSMNGGLLFIGIFFSLIFTMCLILIMYYKQITEGYDDRDNFDIMQKVGMSDAEVRGTIKKQILMVFFMPLLVAILHTMAGFNMISGLLGAVYLYDTRLIIMCGLIVAVLFAILYGLSYNITSRTYYNIVRKMNDNEIAGHLDG